MRSPWTLCRLYLGLAAAMVPAAAAELNVGSGRVPELYAIDVHLS